MFKAFVSVAIVGVVFACGYAAAGNLGDWISVAFTASPMEQLTMVATAAFSVVTISMSLALVLLLYAVVIMMIVGVFNEVWYNVFQRKVFKLMFNRVLSKTWFAPPEQEQEEINMRKLWDQEHREHIAERHEAKNESAEKKQKHRERMERIKLRQEVARAGPAGVEEEEPYAEDIDLEDEDIEFTAFLAAKAASVKEETNVD